MNRFTFAFTLSLAAGASQKERLNYNFNTVNIAIFNSRGAYFANMGLLLKVFVDGLPSCLIYTSTV